MPVSGDISILKHNFFISTILMSPAVYRMCWPIILSKKENFCYALDILRLKNMHFMQGKSFEKGKTNENYLLKTYFRFLT